MKLLSDLQVKMPKMFSDGRRLQLIVCSTNEFDDKVVYGTK